jgi:sulfur transfer protein SufE
MFPPTTLGALRLIEVSISDETDSFTLTGTSDSALVAGNSFLVTVMLELVDCPNAETVNAKSATWQMKLTDLIDLFSPKRLRS